MLAFGEILRLWRSPAPGRLLTMVACHTVGIFHEGDDLFCVEECDSEHDKNLEQARDTNAQQRPCLLKVRTPMKPRVEIPNTLWRGNPPYAEGGEQD